ncbi:hypothetical protein [Geobacter sp. AOG1]|uniref:hypothetical protein n=1 Tax=Geobacter sp. AOG1 TaxID=1566346 RepID=UPI001CC62FCD|nr:hypothetical protein [Geobacter sp. AOG1]GFE58907.1 hypothetical protein AOG1_27870 [Geobacter sp. AOG1]
MKKNLAILIAVSLFAAATPVLAEEAHQHGAAQQTMDEQCARECEMLLKNCALDVDTIQDRIKKLRAEISEKGANAHTRDQLNILEKKLEESNELLKSLYYR